jgi:hypothetical protein
MRSTASLASRFAVAARSISEVSSGSLKLVYQVAALAGVAVTWLTCPLAGGAAVALHATGTSGLSALKVGPTVQPIRGVAISTTATMQG